MSRTGFDLALSFPQWQGSGRPDHLPSGAAATAEVCGRFAPLARVPLSKAAADLGGVNRGEAVLEQFLSARTALDLAAPDRVLVAGGDCGIDVAVVDWMLRRHPDLSVVWVDAHLDANTPESTPSGNFHGMPVASIMGEAPDFLRGLLGRPLDPARFRYVSAHVGDDGDWEFQRSHGLRWLQQGEALPDGPVHVHFDLDALDPGEFPHVTYPEGRLALCEGLALLRGLADGGGLVGLTVAEFAPADDVAAAASEGVLAALCEAACGR